MNTLYFIGKCHTLNGGLDIRHYGMYLHSQIYRIYFHDSAFFLLNRMHHNFPGIIVKHDFKTSSLVLDISLTKHIDLHRESNPCKKDPDYDFQQCVRNSLVRKIGCKLPWDMWSSADFNVCTEVDELRSFARVYNIMYTEDLYLITNRTGCPKPCQYKEYKLVGKEQNKNEEYDQYIYFKTKEEVIIEKELLSYSGLSLLADIGGTLGMFLNIVLQYNNGPSVLYCNTIMDPQYCIAIQ